MKAKTLVACVLTAAAAAPALAQNAEPSGPQGTGWYGAPNAAVPVPRNVQPADANAVPADANAVPKTTQPADRYAAPVARDTRKPVRERGQYDGPSWDTNPPAPPA
jgi:hypothetical protein